MTAGAMMLFACFCLIYLKTNANAAFTLSITFGTIAYHFLMRLTVGQVISLLMKNKADYTKKIFQCQKWEEKLYKRLNIKKWKQNMPTFMPDDFDPRKHNWDEIAQAMCQAEVVHVVIMVLSFVPVCFSVWFGAFPVFVITSFLAASLDLPFIMIQRYNRSRIIRMLK